MYVCMYVCMYYVCMYVCMYVLCIMYVFCVYVGMYFFKYDLCGMLHYTGSTTCLFSTIYFDFIQSNCQSLLIQCTHKIPYVWLWGLVCMYVCIYLYMYCMLHYISNTTCFFPYSVYNILLPFVTYYVDACLFRWCYNLV